MQCVHAYISFVSLPLSVCLPLCLSLAHCLSPLLSVSLSVSLCVYLFLFLSVSHYLSSLEQRQSVAGYIALDKVCVRVCVRDLSSVARQKIDNPTQTLTHSVTCLLNYSLFHRIGCPPTQPSHPTHPFSRLPTFLLTHSFNSSVNLPLL